MSSVYSQGWGGVTYPNIKDVAIVDSANFRFTYELKFMQDSTKQNSIVEQTLVLLVGDKLSKCFNVEYEFDKRMSIPGVLLKTSSEGLAATEVYKNKLEGEMTVRVRSDISGSFEYNEPIPIQSWKISSEKKCIQSYDCQKATTTYLGRTCIAWFTPEIPISNGPWKFGGLPGLILSISDNRKHYVFDCVGIKSLKIRQPIVWLNEKHKHINRKKLNQIIKFEYKHSTEALKASGAVEITYVDQEGNPIPKEMYETISYPYNPIELE